MTQLIKEISLQSKKRQLPLGVGETTSQTLFGKNRGNQAHVGNIKEKNIIVVEEEPRESNSEGRETDVMEIEVPRRKEVKPYV